MKLVEGGVIPETIKALENVKAVLEAAGSGVEKVVKATIFVEDLGDFAKVNEEYKKGNCVTIWIFRWIDLIRRLSTCRQDNVVKSLMGLSDINLDEPHLMCMNCMYIYRRLSYSKSDVAFPNFMMMAYR